MDTIHRETEQGYDRELGRNYIGELGHTASQLAEIAVYEWGLAHSELQIEPTAQEYAQLPINEAFDWQDILEQVRDVRGIDTSVTPIYLVVFRSLLKPGADIELLTEHDAMAHIAAQQSPALLYYFGGTADEQGRALSFCIWSDREEAKNVSRDTSHANAMRMVCMYESYGLEKYFVSAGEDRVIFESVA